MKQVCILSIVLVCILHEVKTENTLLNLLLRAYANEFDGEFKFSCPAGELLKRIESIHDNYYEDRRWQFTCFKPRFDMTDTCKWHTVENKMGEAFSFKCPMRGILGGMGGIHHNSHEDREFKFLCCDPVFKGAPIFVNCKYTAKLNEFDQKLDYTVPEKMIINGVYTLFSGYDNDREFQFNQCST